MDKPAVEAHNNYGELMFLKYMISAIIIVGLWTSCNGRTNPSQPRRPVLPPTPSRSIGQVVTFQGQMNIDNPTAYENFLQTHGVCQRRLALGNSKCENWQTPALVSLSFDPRNQNLTQFSLTPYGSRGSVWNYNQGQPGTPITASGQSPLQNINRDEGWETRIIVQGLQGATTLTLQCGACDRPNTTNLNTNDFQISNIQIYTGSNLSASVGTISALVRQNSQTPGTQTPFQRQQPLRPAGI